MHRFTIIVRQKTRKKRSYLFVKSIRLEWFLKLRVSSLFTTCNDISSRVNKFESSKEEAHTRLGAMTRQAQLLMTCAWHFACRQEISHKNRPLFLCDCTTRYCTREQLRRFHIVQLENIQFLPTRFLTNHDVYTYVEKNVKW